MNRATLLRWLWIGQLRASPGRALAAVTAIAIGVALGLGIHLVNRSALEEFDAALSVVGAEAQASLIAVAGTFDEAAYPQVARDPSISAASPVLRVEVMARSGPRTSRLEIFGLDAMRAAEVSPALLPSAGGEGSASDLFADDALFLSTAALQGLEVRVGDRLTVRAGAREAQLRVAGLVPGAAAGQRLGVMDLGALQWRLDALGRLSRIDLRLAPGTPATQTPPSLRDVLPAELVWSTPEASRRRMSNLSRAYRVNLSVLALVALFTGGFIVYATVSLAALRQQPELALLGVLGAPPRLLAAQVTGQGALLGVAGALIGVAGGIGLAHATLNLVGGDLGGGYFAGTMPTLAPDPIALIGFGLLGLVTGLAGSLPAALGLRGMAPARVLRAGPQGRSASRRALLLPGVVLAAIGALLAALPPIAGLPLAAYAAIALWLVAAIALVPAVVRLLGTALSWRRLHAWRSPAAWLALQRLRGAPASATPALAGVVASVALASAMAIMVHSFRVSVDRWLDAVLPADLYMRTQDGSARAALDDAAQQVLRTLPGVTRAEFLRASEIQLDANRPPVTLLVRDLGDADPSTRLPMTGTLLQAPAGTVPIHVSEAMVDLYDYAPGQRVALPLGIGKTSDDPRFFVAGIWRDYARQHGTVAIAIDDFVRLGGDRTVSDVALWLAPAANPEQVIAAARTALPTMSMDFRSTGEIRALSLTIFDRSFAVTYVLEAIAILVGLFGVAATYSGEALARAREFGMLRHLGITRSQVARIFAIEAGTLIAAGLAWGGVVGAGIAALLVHRVNPQSFHWTMDMAWPWGLLGATAAALLLTGLLVATVSSRSATGANPVRAVRSDW